MKVAGCRSIIAYRA